jgi:hypothetical protein
MTLLSIQATSVRPGAADVAVCTQQIRGWHSAVLTFAEYRNDRYVLRHRRNELPSNTPACFYALTEDVKRRRTRAEDFVCTRALFDVAVQRDQHCPDQLL